MSTAKPTVNLLDLDGVVSDTSEFVEPLATGKQVRIERIISTGQSSPEGFWYDQSESEWVVVLQGRAGLRIEGEAHARVLSAGDSLEIPANCKHRVDWTDKGEPTVWLAIFYQGV